MGTNGHSGPGAPLLANEDRACFLVTKHSWKGKYKRIFSIGTQGLSTYNPQTLEVTNQWAFGDVVWVKAGRQGTGGPGPAAQGDFSIHVRQKSGKAETMKFSSESATELVSEALQQRSRFAEPRPTPRTLNGYKHHWSDARLAVVLQVAEAGLAQLSPAAPQAQPLALYQYRLIEELAPVSDYPGGFVVVYGPSKRLHLFACQGSDQLLPALNQAAFDNIGVGVRIRKQPITFAHFVRNRLGSCGSDAQVTSFIEFTVHKISPRHAHPQRRLLCLSESCVVERDPASYVVVTVRPLGSVACLVRCETNPQAFAIEYRDGARRDYTGTERDNVLASLVDGVRASGNLDVHVRMRGLEAGLRLGPASRAAEAEDEGLLCRHLVQAPALLGHRTAVRRFNTNIPYSGLRFSVSQDGLFADNKEKLIVACLNSLLGLAQAQGPEASGPSEPESPEDWEADFQALRRLFASKAGFQAFLNVPGLREKLGKRVVDGLKLHHAAIDHAAIDMLCALVQPMHSHFELRTEQMNKSSLLHSSKFMEHLLDVTTEHVERGTGALVISAMLDFLTYAVCAPYSETTMGDQFDLLLDLIAKRGRSLYRLFLFPSTTIVKGTGLVMKALIEEAPPDMSVRMQELSLSEGALLRHLHTALFTESKDVRMLTNRQLSRRLIALWLTNNEPGMRLLARALPKGLLSYLDSDAKVPLEQELLNTRNNLEMAREGEGSGSAVLDQVQEVQRVLEKQMDALLDHWKLRQKVSFLQKKEEKVVKPVVLRKRRERVKPVANWKLFFHEFGRDHSQPDLIWNHKTREELKEALEAELRALSQNQELTATARVAWNHPEFEVHYPSLEGEVRIGGYFLRLLLEEDRTGADDPTPIHNPTQFFFEIYHHFLLSGKAEMRCLCLEALAIVYARHHERIGAFADTKYVVTMLQRSMELGERDKLVLFLSKLILNEDNVRAMVNSGGVADLVDLATLAHLHTSRAYVHSQTNVIEASADMSRDGAAEWFYSRKEGDRQGPVSFTQLKELYQDGEVGDKTRCWAQGLEGWKPLASICQLRWCLAASGTGSMDPSQLATLILEMLIRMCEWRPSRDAEGCIVRPVPKVQGILSSPATLPHLVQLLLTFDPIIVQRTATLIYLLIQDNPYISRLYLSGLFFFILMYTGSNVLPVANLLHYTHLKQAYRSETAKSELVAASVLAPLLPEAAIFYLENYGPEKYAEVFLGEFDNPEIIWNSEMRRSMVERLAGHVGDFSVRLPSNVRALYQFCPCASLEYPALEEELFCHIYYLRHLCDTTRFPDWPIKEPITFLKACLAAWHEEIEKKPSSMSVEDAAEVLGLPASPLPDEPHVRKAYFKLAQKYHPDKNPEGREMFEKINGAYEFLSSKAAKVAKGPDQDRIVLCLRAQSIVYGRHSDELRPYKYAGYTQLIKTIRLESSDSGLFRKDAPLLAAATELCQLTLACSALNAEQLRREAGLEALQDAFDRCVSVLSASAAPDDLAVQVATHVARSYATAAQFEGCREKLSQMGPVFSDLVHVLYFRELVALSVVGAECVGAFAVCPILQTNLFQAGAVWNLLPNIFHYDFTLDQGGVSKSETTNSQELENKLARSSCEALARLAGLREGCPGNAAVAASLSALLTPYIVRLLADSPVDYVLKLLNSNSRTPVFVWDNGTRSQMLEFVEAQRGSGAEPSEEMGAEFRFEAFAKELVIGHVFVRLYNEQPSFVFEQPKAFCVELLEFLGKEAQYLHSLISLGVEGAEGRLGDVAQAIRALSNVLKANPGLELQCIGHFKLLLAYLRVEQLPELQMAALEVVSAAAANQDCVSDIAAANVTLYMFLLLKTVSASAHLVLSTLLTLASHGKVVKDALEMGGLVYVLDVFANHDDGEVRALAAELLAKLQSDKLTGPRWARLLLRFLPPIFAEAVRDSPAAAIRLFDSQTENPELIWTDGTRDKVKRLLSAEASQLLAAQKDNPEYMWRPREGEECAYEDLVAGELVVGGVFLRLFVANPSWVLRQPRVFLTELVERFLTEVRKEGTDSQVLETLTSALVGFLQAQPTMLEQVGTQGYVPQVTQALRTKDEPAARSLLLLFHQLSFSALCVEALVAADVLPGLASAIRLRPDVAHEAAKGLRALFARDNSVLVGQALRHDFVPFLLSLLDSPLPQCPNPQAVRAEIVQALKAMTTNLEHGPDVQSLLDQSATWKEFKDQRHDLFIANTPQIAAIRAGSGVAGYLTAGTAAAAAVPDLPPET